MCIHSFAPECWCMMGLFIIVLTEPFSPTSRLRLPNDFHLRGYGAKLSLDLYSNHLVTTDFLGIEDWPPDEMDT